MIDVIEVRDENRVLIGIIDSFQSVIWHPLYFSVGDFEVYTAATESAVSWLKAGNFVTRKDSDEIAIIESVSIKYDAQNGRMIIAKGRFAKSILDRRIVYKLSGTSISPSVSYGLVETEVRELIDQNIISSGQAARNIPFIKLGALKGLTQRIVDEDGDPARKQTSYANLLEYTDGFLQEYGFGATMLLDRVSLDLLYQVYSGTDRSAENTEGNEPVVFSQDFDNLLSSEYSYQSEVLKTTALIGGAGEGVNRFCAMIGDSAAGVNRREMWIDESGQAREIDNGDGTTTEYSAEEYSAILKTAGLQKIEPYKIIEEFNGEIDTSNSNSIYGRDYFLGDIVTVQDNFLNKSMARRVVGVTEVQDESGYMISIEFGG